MSEEVMTDEELDILFRKLIDKFIDQANSLAQHNNAENVGLALLHAASRFNAFVVSTHATTLSDYEKDLDQARAFFISQYESMLNENLEDYKKAYDDMKYTHLMN